MSKLDEIRERRRKERRRRQTMTLLVVAAAAVAVAALLAWSSNKPIGAIIAITPFPRPLADGTALGPVDAPVLLEEYSDFQCPACAGFAQDTEKRLVATYAVEGKMRLIFRQFPFLGQESIQAAHASMCAAEQGRFWDYHDILFANQTGEGAGAFSDRRLLAYADQLGLKAEEFGTCFREKRYGDEINADYSLGLAAGVKGTPSIFINGKKIDPGHVPGFDLLAQEIDLVLAGAAGAP